MATQISPSLSPPPPSEYVAVILAGSIGTRLYPVTTDEDDNNIPKHLLPVAGIPILLRLLSSIELCGFVQCVLLLKDDDTSTMDVLLHKSTTLQYPHPYRVVPPENPPPKPSSSSSSSTAAAANNKINETDQQLEARITVVQSTRMKVTIVQYHTPCTGTVDALCRISRMNHHHHHHDISSSHMVVFPSDLMVLDTTPILRMIHEHRCHEYHTNSSNQYTVHHCSTTPSPHATTTTATSAAHPPGPLLTSPMSTTTLATTTTMAATTPIHATTLHPTTMETTGTLPLSAGTVLLMNVTATDESTLQPIYKESAKQKKGLLSREEDDVFYMAIQSTKSHCGVGPNTTKTDRLIWKQAKFDVEEDKEQIGTTPKVKIPKFRLYGGGSGATPATHHSTTQISTEWNDVHCYCLSSWVVQQLRVSEKFQESLRYQSVQYDLLPLLISRQYRGIEATFHSSKGNTNASKVVVPVDTNQNQTAMRDNQSPQSPSQTNIDDREYMVLAHVSDSRTIASATPSIFRSHTIASYLFANRIMAHEISAMNVTSLQQQHLSSSSSSLTNPLLWQVPNGATIQSKFHTILLPDCHVREKVTFKSCVIGRHCTIGNNCRLNNVVLHDHVTIGDNTTLQSTIVSAHVTIGSNCNFNDCQILHHTNIPSNTKKKGEAITSIDD